MNRNQIKRAMQVGANPSRIAADQERRRSGAAGAHDPRPNRQRSRRDARRAAIREFA